MSLRHYRRGLLRGLTPEAADIIRAGNIPDEGAFEYCHIPDKLYERHFQLFNDLDRICGVAGDDFEVEEIEIERLACVSKTLKVYPRRDVHGKLDYELDDLLDRMWGICQRAQEQGLAVFLLL